MTDADRFVAYQAIMLHLALLLTLDEHEAWLQTPRIDLNGISPAQAIEAGQHEAVLRVLRLMHLPSNEELWSL